MVQDVFEISKAASDQLPVKPEVLDFGKLLRQTLADMDGEIQKSGLTFKLDLPEQPVDVIDTKCACWLCYFAACAWGVDSYLVSMTSDNDTK